MKSGWNFFFALLVADVAYAIADWLVTERMSALGIGACAFVIMLIVLGIHSLCEERRKKKENALKEELNKARQAQAENPKPEVPDTPEAQE